MEFNAQIRPEEKLVKLIVYQVRVDPVTRPLLNAKIDKNIFYWNGL